MFPQMRQRTGEQDGAVARGCERMWFPFGSQPSLPLLLARVPGMAVLSLDLWECRSPELLPVGATACSGGEGPSLTTDGAGEWLQPASGPPVQRPGVVSHS